MPTASAGDARRLRRVFPLFIVLRTVGVCRTGAGIHPDQETAPSLGGCGSGFARVGFGRATTKRAKDLGPRGALFVRIFTDLVGSLRTRTAAREKAHTATTRLHR